MLDDLGIGLDPVVHLILSKRTEGWDRSDAEYLGRTETDSVGRFSLEFTPETETFRKVLEAGTKAYVTAVATHPHWDRNWFGATTLGADLVIDGPSRIEVPVRLTVEFQGREEDGVVTVWREFDPTNPRRQAIAVEVRDDLPHLLEDPSARHQGYVTNGTVRLQVPETVEVAYPDDDRIRPAWPGPERGPFQQAARVSAALDQGSIGVPLAPALETVGAFSEYRPPDADPTPGDVLKAAIGLAGAGVDAFGILSTGLTAESVLGDDTEGPPEPFQSFGDGDVEPNHNLHDVVAVAWKDESPAYVHRLSFEVPGDVSFRDDDWGVLGRWKRVNADPEGWVELDERLAMPVVPDGVEVST